MKKLIIGAAMLIAAGLSGPGAAFAQEQVDVAKAEAEGQILLYSTHDETFWKGVFDAFTAKHPTIKIDLVPLGGGELWERYRAEASTGVRTADLVAGGSPNQFVLAAEHGDVMDFKPVGLAEHLGDFPMPEPGLIPVALDVYSIIYNKAILPEALWPTGLKDLGEKAAANPGVFNGKVATWDPFSSNVGQGFTVALDRDYGDIYWTALKNLAPALKFEGGATQMMDKVTSGEYVAAYIVSRSRIKALSATQQKIVGWTPFDGPEPATVFTAAVPAKSQNVDAAKLFVEYLITPEAQDLLAQGGLYAINPGATAEDTLSAVVKAQGGVSIYGHSKAFMTYDKDYLPRVNAAFGK